MNPKVLYHGSTFLHDELKPGFHHTGQLVQWDHTESNHFLYASTLEKDAFDQAFAGWLERTYQIDHYQSKDGKITVTLSTQKVPTPEELEGVTVYVYEIAVHPEDWWVKNNNLHNNLTTEWKTENVIPKSHIVKVRKYDTRTIANRVHFVSRTPGLESHEVNFNLAFQISGHQNRPIYLDW